MTRLLATLLALGTLGFVGLLPAGAGAEELEGCIGPACVKAHEHHERHHGVVVEDHRHRHPGVVIEEHRRPRDWVIIEERHHREHFWR